MGDKAGLMSGPAGVRAPRPPVLPGTIQPRVRDAALTLWWVQVGWLHGLRRPGPLLHRAASAAGLVFCWTTGLLTGAVVHIAAPAAGSLAVWWAIGLLLFPIALAVVLASPWRRWYMSPSRDAVLCATITWRGRAWRLGEHMSARPGTGLGTSLRAAVLPGLAGAADLAGVTVTAHAATADLGSRYIAGLPGPIDTRGARRGVVITRPPA